MSILFLFFFIAKMTLGKFQSENRKISKNFVVISAYVQKYIHTIRFEKEK